MPVLFQGIDILLAQDDTAAGGDDQAVLRCQRPHHLGFDIAEIGLSVLRENVGNLSLFLFDDHLVRVHHPSAQLLRQEGSQRGLAGHGHAGQDNVALGIEDLLIDQVGRLPVKLPAREDLRGVDRLDDQHVEASRGRDPALLRLQDQDGAQGIVDHVDDTAQIGELTQLHRTCVNIRIHAAGGRVDNDLGVRVLLIHLLVSDRAVLAGPADPADDGSALILDHRAGGLAGSAAAQDEDLPARRVRPVQAQEFPYAKIIRIVSAQPAIPVDDGVDGPDPAGPVADLIQIRDHPLLVGDRHIDPFEILLPHEAVDFIGRKLQHIILIRRQFFMNDL